MRSLDNWTPYYGRQNKPLYGRLTFYKLHTTELQPIYNEDGTVPLPNPISTSQYGLTDVQVFLTDNDYTVKVEKWMGAGEYTLDDPNVEDWEEIRTFDNLYPAIMVHNADGLVSKVEVTTMNSLRDVDVSDTDINYAVLLGYYELGDMPPQFYKLVDSSDSTIQDDGGSIIRPAHSTNKLWILIPQENIDVRVFGVFPAPTISENVSQTSNIHACFNYANAQGKDVYVPLVYDSVSYYFLEGGMHDLRQKLVVDKGVHIVAKPLTTTKLALAEIQHYGEQLFISTGDYGTLTVNCPTVKLSWKCNDWLSWPGTVSTFIVDKLNSSFDFDTATVIFESKVMDKTLGFTNCKIESKGMIETCTVNLTNCGEVTDRWLGTGCTVVLNGNDIFIKNFSNANTYIAWKNLQLESDYGDLLGMTVTDAELEGQNIEISHFTGSIILPTNVNVTTINDFNGSINRHVNAAGCSLYIDQCSIILTGNLNYTVLNAKRSALSTGGAVVSVSGYTHIEDCTIGFAINSYSDATFIRSTIGAVLQTPASNLMKTVLEGCTLLGQYTLNPTADGTIFNGRIINNYSAVADPITMVRTYFNPIDSNHAYSYHGNTGTFLPDLTASTAKVVTVKYALPFNPRPWEGNEGQNVLFRTSVGTSIYFDNRTTYFDKVKFFRIGQDRFRVKTRFDMYSANFFYDSPNGSYSDVCLGAYSTANPLEWEIKPWWDDPSLAADQLTSTASRTVFHGLLSHSSEDTPSNYTENVMVSYESLDKRV